MKKIRGRKPTFDLSGQRRTILKNLRFSEKEWDLVQIKMAESKIDEFSEYARLACLQVSPIALDSEGLDLKNKMQVLDMLIARLKC